MTDLITIAGPVVAAVPRPRPRRRHRRWGEAAALVALAGLALVIEHHLWPPISVAVVTVDHGPVRAVVRSAFPGSLDAHRRIRLGPDVSGRVARVLVRAGDRVRKGAALLTVEAAAAREHRAARRQLLATATRFERDQCAAAACAADRVGRTRWLAELGLTGVSSIATAQDLQDVANGGCDAASAWVAWARVAVVQAQEDVAATVLRAPFDAVVVSVDTAEGDVLAGRREDVIELIDAATLYVEAPFDEWDARQIQVGAPVQLTSRPAPGSVAGRVRRIGRSSDLYGDDGTVRVEVDLPEAAALAWLIAAAAVDATVTQVHEEATRIPVAALIDGRTVFVVRDGRVETVVVDVGLVGDRFIEVTAGLRRGETVVMSTRWPLLANGMRVRTTAIGPG